MEFTDRTLPEFWLMTEAETAFNIRIGQKRLHHEIELQTQLVIAVMNAPFGPWLNGKEYPFKYVPSDHPDTKTEISEQSKARTWAAAGKAMMEEVQRHERDVKQCGR